MKQFVHFFFFNLFLFLSISAKAQCLSGGITFSTQAQIDNFATNYPGCHKILGDVIITGSDITNLNGLNTLNSFGGQLDIRNNPLLTSVSGLNALTSIGGTFFIISNPLLTSVSGLNALTSIGGAGLLFDTNAALTTISGFSALKTTSSYIYIQNNAALTTISGFGALTTINYQFVVQNNKALNIITGFGALIDTYQFLIQNNVALTTINGFNALNDIRHDFQIQNNPALININGFGLINNVGGIFSISQSSITNLSNFSSLTSIGNYLDIENNPNLTNLNGLSALQFVNSYASIYNNAALTNLNGLSSLQSINGDFFISNNTHLTSITGLTALTTINGNLQINNNNILTSLSGLNNITPSSITNLIIQDNAQLSTCAVKSTCGYLQTTPLKPSTISGNLSGCNSGSEVLAACVLVGLPIDLISFTAKNVGTYNVLNWRTATETNNTGFEIERSNGSNAFEKIGFVRGAVNSSSVVNYTFNDENPLKVGNYYRLKQNDIDGKFTYSNIIEVQNNNTTTFGVSPNPSNDKIYVSGITENTVYSITNIQGQVLQSGVLKNYEPITISNLQEGLYFLRTTSQTAKFVKEN